MRKVVLSAICSLGIFTIMAQNNMSRPFMQHMRHTFTTYTTDLMNIQERLSIKQLSTDASSATDTLINASELPSAVVYTLADTYPGGHITRVYAGDDNGTRVYKVHIMTKDNTEVIVRIDEKGNLI